MYGRTWDQLFIESSEYKLKLNASRNSECKAEQSHCQKISQRFMFEVFELTIFRALEIVLSGKTIWFEQWCFDNSSKRENHPVYN